MKDLLSFDTLVTPKILTLIYWLGLVAVVISGVVTFFTSLFAGSLKGMAGGLLWILLGGLIVRLYCELLIVVFKMNEALQEIRKK
ncbi:MAG: DUF4282 domain-containing protein [Betaproteobacteria bacterium]|nr:DUF4282 domain-containing protein [Betaproteobacteria bacterium]